MRLQAVRDAEKFDWERIPEIQAQKTESYAAAL
jgi:hypothetical protein